MRAASIAMFVVCLLLACGSTDAPAASDAPAPGPESESQPPSEGEAPTSARADGARCLPVVAADCGCVYECGVGEPAGEGAYRVTHSFWDDPVNARVDRWCVNEECTDAFFAEIVCGVICAPRPADWTCGFRRGRCVTGREGAMMIEGAYRVFFARDRQQSGALTLSPDGRYMYTGARQPEGAGEPFYFVTHPMGSYSFDMDAQHRGRRPSEIPDGATLGVLHFDRNVEGYSATDRRRSLEIRYDGEGRQFEMHSIVSEFQLWRIEAARRP